MPVLKFLNQTDFKLQDRCVYVGHNHTDFTASQHSSMLQHTHTPLPNLSFSSATHSDLYKNTLKQYIENKYVQESTGFKPLAEIINGRAAMLVRLLHAHARDC